MRPPKQKPKHKKPLKTEYTPEEFKELFVMQGGTKARKKQEEDVQLELCKWLQDNYPNCLFCSDIAGRDLSVVDRSVYDMRSKTANDETVKFPDLTIYDHAGTYIGLVLELKNAGVQLTKKDGTLRANDHVQKQYECLQRFSALGWAASFAVGLQAAKDLIISYFNGQKIEGNF